MVRSDAPAIRSTSWAADFVLLVTEGQDPGLEARPVDPLSLADLPGREPIDLGHHFTAALSPAGETLAVFSWPGSAGSKTRLRVIDVVRWREYPTGAEAGDHVGHLVFGDQGTLYWAEPTGYEPTHDMGRNFALFLYRLEEEAEEPVTYLPASFVPWDLRSLPGGGLVLYGVPTDARGLAEGSPRVMVVEPEDGEIIFDLPLENVEAGVVEQPGTDARYLSQSPGLAWHLDRRLLYVAHADQDTVTAVDLGAGRLVGPERPSLLGRLGRWLVPRAEAKLSPGTDRQVVLNHEGKHLFAAGLRRELSREAGELELRETPLGLVAFDAETLREVSRVDLPVSNLALSPSGQDLLLWGRSLTARAEEKPRTEPSGLYVLDAETLEERAQFTPKQGGAQMEVMAFSPDGRHAYLRSWVHRPPDLRQVNIQVLELSSLRFVAERSSRGYVQILPAAEM
ncbi:MAG: YncE family protein [Acidimicrobiia bacterium]